ncbi:tetratricopeptide repeat protein [Haematobacter genomosp. 1]|uniref:Uncharacterized protein n=1 Tax=Haematobacter genomosp. 1 TaxID=366618 RepID=A0A212ABR6_9RHOB|nr:tetratricopeptide repeat protein [Haematobacter genomosp. 1]OWJ78159.1 hypothetical protein CDV49_09365 [Haematobacter genomosp. 1]
MFQLSRLAASLLCGTALLLGATTAWADGYAGPYLAGRAAAGERDYRAAGTYFHEALSHDPGNAQLQEFALLSDIGRGEFDAALKVAQSMQREGQDSQLADLLLLVDMIGRKDWAAVKADVQGGPKISPLIDGLAGAWAEFGLGRMSDAQAAFDKVAGNEPLKAFALYHKALALAAAGDFEGAQAILGGETGRVASITRRGVVAQVEVLSQLDRDADAIALIDSTFQGDPEMDGFRARLEAGETLPFDVVRSASDGMAEAFHGVAGVLANGGGEDGFTLVYARMAEHLRPDFTEAILMVAGILEKQGQYDLATVAYNRIPRNDPAFHVAEMGRASALYDGGRTEAALEAMEQLAKSSPDVLSVQVAYGDMLRRQEKFAEAAQSYDRAIALLGTPGPQHWPLFFARGIAFERSGQWPKAEADFRKALELAPDQPAVLNYLGYSYVERHEHLDEALGMIQRAVDARPDDGAITDSLGWALFRLGRYDEAVGHLERAAELMPVDPVVNDHLGDVFWAVGRKLEADFQWRRALSFNPEEDEAARIRKKLSIGLDAVLKEEGAPPIVRTGNAD